VAISKQTGSFDGKRTGVRILWHKSTSLNVWAACGQNDLQHTAGVSAGFLQHVGGNTSAMLRHAKELLFSWA